VFGANVCLGVSGCRGERVFDENCNTIVTCFDLLSVSLSATVVFVREKGRKPPNERGEQMFVVDTKTVAMAESLAERFRAIAGGDETNEATASWLFEVAELLDQVK